MVGANRAQYKRLKVQANQEYKSIKQDCYNLEHPVKVVEKYHKATLKKISINKAIEIKKADLMYFFNINGHFIESTDIISKKLNQGLGTKVFTKEFLVEFPHDAYKISNKGLKVTIEETLDYGNFKLLKCFYIDALKEKKYLYINSKKEYKNGSELFIEFDIVKSSIIETGMDIKLY